MAHILILNGEHYRSKNHKFNKTIPLSESVTSRRIQHIVHEISKDNRVVITSTIVHRTDNTTPEKR